MTEPVNYDYVKAKREDVQEIPDKQQPMIQKFMRLYTRLNVWVFKKSKGRLWKNFPGGFPICVIGMTGRKSGGRREVALIHCPYKDGILLVASQGGMNKHPAWYFNLAANAEIDVLVAGVTRKLSARQASVDEKRELWPTLLGFYPDFDEYQARTDRDIPVFICQ